MNIVFSLCTLLASILVIELEYTTKCVTKSYSTLRRASPTPFYFIIHKVCITESLHLKKAPFTKPRINDA
jgi:hypothetical protein